jgi:hypothetical protein
MSLLQSRNHVGIFSCSRLFHNLVSSTRGSDDLVAGRLAYPATLHKLAAANMVTSNFHTRAEAFSFGGDLDVSSPAPDQESDLRVPHQFVVKGQTLGTIRRPNGRTFLPNDSTRWQAERGSFTEIHGGLLV